MPQEITAEALAKKFTPKETRAVETQRQVCLARFSHDGKLLLTGGYDAMLRRWDFSGEMPQEISSIEGHRGWVQNFVLHPTEKLIYSADSWGQIRCTPYEEEQPQPRWQLQDVHDGWIRALDITPDGKLLVSGGKDGRVRVFSTADGKQLHEFEMTSDWLDEVFSVAIHPDGKSVVAANLYCTVKHWSLATGECEREFEVKEMYFYERIQDVCGLRIMRFHDDGKTLLCAGSKPTKAGRVFGVPSILFYDWETLQLRHTMEQGDANEGFVYDFAQHADGFFMSAISSQPGKGKLAFQRLEDEKPFFSYTKMSNCHSLAPRPDHPQFVVTATNRNSQGNGTVLDKEGRYVGNYSPLHVFQFEPQAS